MRLSARARYAVRLMIELDRLGKSKSPVRLSEISRRTGISRRFLEQLAIGLKNRSLVASVPGRNGGYSLARSPESISVRDMITAAIGPISLATCVEDPLVCMSSEFCECRMIWALLQKQIDKLLERYSLADLSNPRAMTSIRKQIEAADKLRKCREDGLAAVSGAAAGIPACARTAAE